MESALFSWIASHVFGGEKENNNNIIFNKKETTIA
jgi:hypothetical protein